MEIRRIKNTYGFTLVELMVAMLILIIAISAIGIVFVDSPRSFRHSYGRAYSDVVTQGYAARSLFDKTIRKGIGTSLKISDDGKWLGIFYFGDEDSTLADTYSFLYVIDGKLKVQTGQFIGMGVKNERSTRVLCDNVKDCTFKQRGRSVHMILSLEDELSSQTVVCSAVMHN
jgi:hypothetical protein